MSRSSSLQSPIGLKRSELGNWVDRAVAHFTPERVVWCDGSQGQYDALCRMLLASGTFKPLNQATYPGCYSANSDPSDCQRVEDRTFICSARQEDAGPTNNWMPPDEGRRMLTELSHGSMRGRPMFVAPYCMGPIGSKMSRIGVLVTDSAYVVLNTMITTRVGKGLLDRLGDDGLFIPGKHTVGMPLEPGRKDVPWPCNPVKWIFHYPETAEDPERRVVEESIFSHGSGGGGNAFLGKKCFALRIASAIGRREGWLAEHMLVLALESPWGEKIYIAAALPSGCGKSTLAMLPELLGLPGWKVTTLGDDIAWMERRADGRFWAIVPENGFYPVAPGTSWDDNPNLMAALAKNSFFTNVAVTGDGEPWWEGKTKTPPDHLIDWQERPWTPDCGRPAAHPNARVTVPATNCPSLDPDWDNPNGVPISAFMLGGRRDDTMPIIVETFDWDHGVYMGATLGSQTTAAAAGKVGVVRRDPMAMLPFCGYDMGDYFDHWRQIGRGHVRPPPPIYVVNWFRLNKEGKIDWPGRKYNLHFLKWIFLRVKGMVGAEETPIGRTPRFEDLDLSGMEGMTPERFAQLVRVDRDEWLAELDEHKAWLDKLGKTVPAELHRIQEELRASFA